MRYDSFIPSAYKVNLISCLITRAFRICSTERAFNFELDFLKKYFLNNLFPCKFIDKVFRSTISSFYKEDRTISTVQKKTIYLSLPYLDLQSNSVKRKIIAIVSKFYPQIDTKIIFSSSFKLKNFFKFKDVMPLLLASSVIYKYQCGQCPATYIGETKKQMKVRISQHQGLSFRTNVPLSTKPNSKIYEHAEINDHHIDRNNFKILTNCNNHDL